jgi:hypothetical protein
MAKRTPRIVSHAGFPIGERLMLTISQSSTSPVLSKSAWGSSSRRFSAWRRPMTTPCRSEAAWLRTSGNCLVFVACLYLPAPINAPSRPHRTSLNRHQLSTTPKLTSINRMDVMASTLSTTTGTCLARRRAVGADTATLSPLATAVSFGSVRRLFTGISTEMTRHRLVVAWNGPRGAPSRLRGPADAPGGPLRLVSLTLGVRTRPYSGSPALRSPSKKCSASSADLKPMIRRVVASVE